MGDFIGTGGVVAQAPNAQRSGGLFGGERAHRGGLFGAPANRSGGSFEGLDDSAAGVPITARASSEQADTNAAGFGQGFSGQPAPNATVSGDLFVQPGANTAAGGLFGQPGANSGGDLFGSPPTHPNPAGGLFGQP